MTQIMGIKFAPLYVPMKRRLQTLAVFLWMVYLLFSELASLALIIFILRTKYWFLGFIYGCKIIYDRNDVSLGKKIWKCFWSSKYFKYFAEYFPVTLIKTVDLDPTKNYVFAIFPHGILPLGSFVCFSTAFGYFEKIFPGMKSCLNVLEGHLFVPFFREFLLWVGAVAPTEYNLSTILNKKNGTGKCVGLTIGGTAEALDSHNGKYIFHVRKRKGFVRVAIQNGAPLVPVISFGENEIYEHPSNPNGSRLRTFQEIIRRYTGISPVLFFGRGLFQYSFGIIPHRHPINMVVGEPIEVEQKFEPTEEEIEKVHQKFIEKLTQLFEEGKSKYLPDYPNVKFEIV